MLDCFDGVGVRLDWKGLCHIQYARYEAEVGLVDLLLADTGLPDQVLLRSVALPLTRTAVHNGARLNAHAFARMFMRRGYACTLTSIWCPVDLGH
jgi:hypothetical protein